MLEGKKGASACMTPTFPALCNGKELLLTLPVLLEELLPQLLQLETEEGEKKKKQPGQGWG